MSYQSQEFKCRTCDEVNVVKVRQTFLQDVYHHPTAPFFGVLALAIVSIAASLTLWGVYGPPSPPEPTVVVDYITLNGTRYKVEMLSAESELELEKQEGE